MDHAGTVKFTDVMQIASKAVVLSPHTTIRDCHSLSGVIWLLISMPVVYLLATATGQLLLLLIKQLY